MILERLKNTTKILGQDSWIGDRDLNSGRPNYETKMTTIRPRLWVNFSIKMN
jgi:hypothetical protein